MTLPHSIYMMINHAVRQFYDQWVNGLQPSVKFYTQSDGVVNIISKVSSALPMPERRQPSCQQKRRRRSGRASRIRRRNLRECLMPESSELLVDLSSQQTQAYEESILIK